MQMFIRLHFLPVIDEQMNSFRLDLLNRNGTAV